ncbi:MAG: Spy/CpxP family protein refolding chaperone [Steroidobacteraceae bacterium]
MTALALSVLAGGAMAATDNSGSPGPGDAAPAASAPQNRPQAGDDHRGFRDFHRHGPDQGRRGEWRHRRGWDHGWHRGWYRHGWHHGRTAIIVRPGFGAPPFTMHRGFHRFGPGRASAGGSGMLDRPLLGALRRLDLTTDQRQKVRTILMNARQQATQRRRGAGNAPDFTALLNPGDPNHARAVQAARDRAAQRIEVASATQQNLYNVLTPQQKTQLTQHFAQMRTRMQQRRAARGNQDRARQNQRGDQQSGSQRPDPPSAD